MQPVMLCCSSEFAEFVIVCLTALGSLPHSCKRLAMTCFPVTHLVCIQKAAQQHLERPGILVGQLQPILKPVPGHLPPLQHPLYPPDSLPEALDVSTACCIGQLLLYLSFWKDMFTCSILKLISRVQSLGFIWIVYRTGFILFR